MPVGSNATISTTCSQLPLPQLPVDHQILVEQRARSVEARRLAGDGGDDPGEKAVAHGDGVDPRRRGLQEIEKGKLGTIPRIIFREKPHRGLVVQVPRDGVDDKTILRAAPFEPETFSLEGAGADPRSHRGFADSIDNCAAAALAGVVLGGEDFEARRPGPNHQGLLDHRRLRAAQKTGRPGCGGAEHRFTLSEPGHALGADNGLEQGIGHAAPAPEDGRQRRSGGKGVLSQSLGTVALFDLEANDAEALRRLGERGCDDGSGTDRRPVGHQTERGFGPDPHGEPQGDPGRCHQQQHQNSGELARLFA